MITVQNYKSSVQTKKQLWKKLQWGVLLSLMVLIYGSHAPLITATKLDGRVPFDASSCVVLIESTKLLVSVAAFLFADGSLSLHRPSSLAPVAPYAAPALLYALNNNLVVHMQAFMDPSSFQVLSNLKIASTALLYSLCLSKRLRRRQWLAVALLMCAGVCHSYSSLDLGGGGEDDGGSRHFITVWGLVLVLVYCCVSGLAAVYTEKILKSQKIPLSVQNFYLYVFGVVINGALSLATGERGFWEGFSPAVWVIVLGQAANGLLMSVVLKHGSGITRLFVISCSMLVNALLSWAFLDLQLRLFFLLPVSMVGLAAYLYYR